MTVLNLADDLRNFSKIEDLISQEDFCMELYAALTNNDWYFINKDSTPEEQVLLKLKGSSSECACSFRAAGGIVADLRNWHLGTREDYLEWYCSSTEGIVTERIEKLFNSLGWYRYP